MNDPREYITFMGKKISLWVILTGILLLASFLRLYRLDSVPPSPYWEETALGYDAYSVSKTGKDFHGNPYPIIAFPSFGDYKPSGYFYIEVPFIKVLGLNIWSVRLPSALAGIITVGVLYLIGRELFDRRVGLFASILFALSPWSLQFSRGGWEVNFALMCVVVGSYLLLKARNKPWLLPVSVIFFGYSMYTYHAARVVAPLMGAFGGILLLRFWFFSQSKRQRITARQIISLVLALAIALACTLPLVANLKSNSVSSRFDATSIFSDPTPVLNSNKQIELHGNTRLARIFYHRYWFYGGEIFQNFMKHFSPDFLFVRGDGNLRHSTVAFGLLYPWDAVFILLALGTFIWRKDKRGILIVFSILVSGIAPSLVSPTPHALRFLFAAPGFILLTAYGIAEFTKYCRFNRLKERRVIVVLLYVFSIASYVRYYYVVYPTKAASDWQYGYKQMYESIAKNKRDGEQVYITREQGRPSMYYLFYSSFDPSELQKIEPTLPKDQLELLRVGDYHFVDSLPSNPGLFASSPGKVGVSSQTLDTIKSLDGKTVWVIWRMK